MKATLSNVLIDHAGHEEQDSQGRIGEHEDLAELLRPLQLQRIRLFWPQPRSRFGKYFEKAILLYCTLVVHFSAPSVVTQIVY